MDVFAAALASAPGLGNKRISALLEYFRNAENVWNASGEEIKNAHILPAKVLTNFLNHRVRADINLYYKRMKTAGIGCITCKDSCYPKLLLHTHSPPAVLFYKGELPSCSKTIAVVGSRKSTPYGDKVAYQIAKELSEKHVTIISGGARGIDTQAHIGALDGGDYTVIVAAFGLDYVYPPENKSLFEKVISSGGAIISEYPLGTAPLGRQFPARNRIIAGLSYGVVVIEATKRSGALITVDFALEEGRDVFSVPGSIYSVSSEGTNELLRKGAICVTTGDDIIIEYDWGMNLETNINKKSFVSKEETLTVEEEMVYRFCSTGTYIREEDLLDQLKYSVPQLKMILMSLQLKEKIKEVSSGVFVSI